MKQQGARDWWQPREAALYALGLMTDNIIQYISDGNSSKDGGGGGGLQARLHSILSDVLQQELQGGGESSQFLVGRALWLAAKMTDVIPQEHLTPFLHAAATGISGEMPAPVKIGACKALVHMCAAASPQALQPMLSGLYSGLVGLLHHTNEETLNLVLETLAAVVRSDTSVAAQHLPQIAGPVLQIWSANVSDPLISGDALDVVEALARIRECAVPLAQQIAPSIVQILSEPQPRHSMLPEASLDLLTSVARHGGAEVSRHISSAVMPLLHRLLMVSTDPAILQNGTELLIALLKVSGSRDLGCEANTGWALGTCIKQPFIVPC